MKKQIGLYIHIPFCEQKCLYCDFCSFAHCEHLQKDYVETLKKEIVEFANSHKDIEIYSIFIGGGTPSVLFDGAVFDILTCTFAHLHSCSNAEITIECNPNSLSQQKLQEYKKCGINRISLGVQSLDDNVLKAIGRIHTRQDALNALGLIKKEKFTNFSVDLMSGLPLQSVDIFSKTLDEVLQFEPKHISCYSLILEENTPLHKLVQNGKITLPYEEQCLQMFSLAQQKLQKNGYCNYEVSNFAKPNFECKHNILYWQCKEYVGFGLNAHSYLDGKRFCNTNDLQKYIKQTSFDLDTKSYVETLSIEEQKEEFLMLGLRLKQGVNLDEYAKKFGCDLRKEKEPNIEFLLNNKMITLENNRLFVPLDQMHILNLIINELV